jgi:DNA-binding transcriptional LysR family regulator
LRTRGKTKGATLVVAHACTEEGRLLTEAREIALHYGRRMIALNDEWLDTVRGASLAGNVRLAFSQDFADTILPAVPSQSTKLYPLVPHGGKCSTC